VQSKTGDWRWNVFLCPGLWRGLVAGNIWSRALYAKYAYLADKDKI